VLSTSPRQATHFRLERGYPFALNLEFTKSDDSPIDLSGSSIYFDMDQPDHLGGADIVVARPAVKEVPHTLGRAFFSLQGDDLDLEPGEYPFAFTLQAAGGYGTIVVKGTIEIVGNANDIPLANFTDGGAPFELGVKMLSQNRIVVKTNHLPDKLLEAFADQAASDASAAGGYATAAAGSAAAAATSAAAAAASAVAADASADAAETYRAQASGYAVNAVSAASNAETSADEAAASAAAAAASAAASGLDATGVPSGYIPRAIPGDDWAWGPLELNPPGADGWTIVSSGGEAVSEWEWQPMPAGGVTEVNGETGAVSLSAADVGAAAAAHNHDAAYIAKGDITAIDVITQAAYDALDPKVATTFYVIVG